MMAEEGQTDELALARATVARKVLEAVHEKLQARIMSAEVNPRDHVIGGAIRLPRGAPNAESEIRRAFDDGERVVRTAMETSDVDQFELDTLRVFD
jgi:hypothetical protein